MSYKINIYSCLFEIETLESYVRKDQVRTWPYLDQRVPGLSLAGSSWHLPDVAKKHEACEKNVLR